jgi:hypothetical protein
MTRWSKGFEYGILAMMHVIATEVELNATGPNKTTLKRRSTTWTLYWASNHTKLKVMVARRTSLI